MKIAFLGDDKIMAAADNFLSSYHPDLTLPIPIEEIAELTLKISILPIPALKRVFGHESFINAQFNQITIDAQIYENSEERTRFTIAHELGHFVLHKELYKAQNIKTIEEFLAFQNSFTPQQWQSVHIQADRFAGFVLLPKAKLDSILDEEIASVGGIKSFTITDFRNLVEVIKETFFVSESCIQTKLSIHYPEIYKAALSLQR